MVFKVAAAVHINDAERSLRMTNASDASSTWIDSECDPNDL